MLENAPTTYSVKRVGGRYFLYANGQLIEDGPFAAPMTLDHVQDGYRIVAVSVPTECAPCSD